MTPKPASVDAYIEAAPEAARPQLRQLRALVTEAAPSATARIRYGMPSFDYRARRFVDVSAAKHHIGIYGLVHVDGSVPAALAPHLHDRSTLRFPIGRPLPGDALLAALRDKARLLDRDG